MNSLSSMVWSVALMVQRVSLVHYNRQMVRHASGSSGDVLSSDASESDPPYRSCSQRLEPELVMTTG